MVVAQVRGEDTVGERRKTRWVRVEKHKWGLLSLELAPSVWRGKDAVKMTVKARIAGKNGKGQISKEGLAANNNYATPT